MFKLYKPMMIASCALWLVLIFHIIALEIVGILVETLMITAIITIVLLFAVYAYFIYFYIKSRGQIEKMKRDYLESLKPDKPLRFCPTDDELLRRFKFEEKNKIVVKQNKTEERVNEDAEEDEIEM